MCSARVTPDQPGERVGATAKHQVEASLSDTRGFRNQFRAWLDNHRASLQDSTSRLVRQPLSSFFTCLVMAVALSLPMGLALLLENVSQLGGSWQRAAQISMFLELDAGDTYGELLRDEILKHEHVADAQWISRTQALAEFQEQSGLGEALRELPDNPLPGSILVTPEVIDKEALVALLDELKNMPQVQQAQLDLMWIERLAAILHMGENFIFALAVMLIAALLLVVGNTIRLHIENRRIEIEVIKLVGGTDGYVRRPFLYMGVLYGFAGGVLAWLLLAFGLEWLNDSVTQLAQLYGSDFKLSGVPIEDGFSLLLGAVLLGYIGAWLAVARHLRELSPR
ncbi:MAG TPA: cell division protein FtsX [Gammaproteobacteria bacterium]|nr:cell division protein FtsX [Gammaproteobacteria bacterium]